jgi:hypothetical protein
MTNLATVINTLSGRLACLDASGLDEQALYGFAVGAAYSLAQAVRLGYRGEGPADGYAAEVRAAADAISKGEPPTAGAWLAGYYFNSSLQRLAAAAERIGKYTSGRKWVPSRAVRDDVNQMKHGVGTGTGTLLSEGREATLEDACNTLREVVDALEPLLRAAWPDAVSNVKSPPRREA